MIKTKKQYIDAVKTLRQAGEEYYRNASSFMTDAEYDELAADVKEYEDSHPGNVSKDSPSSKVGDDLVSGFAKVEHHVPMLSIMDVFERGEGDYSEAVDWFDGVKLALDDTSCSVDFIVEPKIDGCAASLEYVDGFLTRVSTRGNGAVGDDITENARHIHGIPQRTLVPGVTCEVRGEIVLDTETFNRLNIQRGMDGLPLFANPRNTVAGTIKLHNPAVVKERGLDFVAHGLVDAAKCFDRYGVWKSVTKIGMESAMSDYIAYLAFLRDYVGVLPVPDWSCVKSRTDVEKALAAVYARRGKMRFGIDGAVIKVVGESLRDKLGCTSTHPRWACAMKFRPERKETVLKSITLQVGRTGAVTPVAELEPVRIAGSTVSRATLHNQDEMDRKDIHIGDTVLVEKSGDIIPAVTGVVPGKRPEGAVKADIMTLSGGKCPACGETLSREDGEAAVRCTNPACPAQFEESICHMLGKDGLDIKGIGPEVVHAVVKAFGITEPVAILALSPDAVMKTPLAYGNGSSIGASTVKAVAGIREAAEKAPLSAWLSAVGIRHVGKTTAKEISAKVSDAGELVAAALDGRIDWCGPVVRDSIRGFFSSEYGKQVARFMQSSGVKSDNLSCGAPMKGPLNGKVFVITGTLSEPRHYFECLIVENGGVVGSSVSKKTDFLLAGGKAGSKLAKAEKLGVPVIDENTFRSMLNNLK